MRQVQPRLICKKKVKAKLKTDERLWVFLQHELSMKLQCENRFLYQREPQSEHKPSKVIWKGKGWAWL